MLRYCQGNSGFVPFSCVTVQIFELAGPGEGKVYKLENGALALVDDYFSAKVYCRIGYRYKFLSKKRTIVLWR